MSATRFRAAQATFWTNLPILRQNLPLKPLDTEMGSGSATTNSSCGAISHAATAKTNPTAAKDLMRANICFS
ncbi:hypothetical protein QO034_17740 [Sedimentitalea sp. JM2-8]|uniref:Uncharacterized protein n=1 Tax=Sedimentitalea xiamensis TaxID=3050037 RepID=A0ABT7FIH7_9RHOB|nr:hypothetical protein [Sedimentitalea xiamensis]MDK3074935.1 hypothetical protein [Sedimentitalea xiamensis]